MATALPALSLRHLQLDPYGVPSPRTSPAVSPRDAGVHGRDARGLGGLGALWRAAHGASRRGNGGGVRAALVLALAVWGAILLVDLLRSLGARHISAANATAQRVPANATRAPARARGPSPAERERERRAAQWVKAMRRVETGKADKKWLRIADEEAQKKEAEMRKRYRAEERRAESIQHRERLAMLKEQDERLEELVRERESLGGWESMDGADSEAESRGGRRSRARRRHGEGADDGNLDGKSLLHTHRLPHSGGILNEQGGIVGAHQEPAIAALKHLRMRGSTTEAPTQWVGAVEAAAQQAIENQSPKERR